MEARLREDMKQLAERVARVEHSQAKLEGFAGRVCARPSPDGSRPARYESEAQDLREKTVGKES